MTIASVGQTFQARFWYDGQYVQNAKEDAAEVALRQMESSKSLGRGFAPTSPGANTATGSGLNIRESTAQHFSPASFISAFNGGDQQGRRADGMGVAWARSPAAAQSGFTKPAW